MFTHGIKGLTSGRENSFSGITWFLGEMKGVLVVAQQSIKGGGGYGKLREESQKYYGALRRENDSMILQTLVKIWKTEMFFFSVAKRSDTS